MELVDIWIITLVVILITVKIMRKRNKPTMYQDRYNGSMEAIMIIAAVCLAFVFGLLLL